jgi:thiamine-monophosphate kinase
MSAPEDEFEGIARRLRPLTRGAPEALGLLDDAALIAPPPGMELVITKDAMVEGVHFPTGAPLDLAAQRLLRANLSDLAAKGATPFGYFLAVCWPPGADRDAFARGLAADGESFGLPLLGGDTSSTPGPLTASITALGWVEAGAMVRRSGARPGDLLAVSGAIGDGCLGLAAVERRIPDPDGYLARRFWAPEPRLDLRDAVLRTSAAVDVSDGLIADAAHIAAASEVAISIDLDRMPLSQSADAWLACQPDRRAALLALATGGEDFEVVVCVLAADLDPRFTVIGEVREGAGVTVLQGGEAIEPGQGGYRHR